MITSLSQTSASVADCFSSLFVTLIEDSIYDTLFDSCFRIILYACDVRHFIWEYYINFKDNFTMFYLIKNIIVVHCKYKWIYF
ncbi:hypothetical protein [Fusobacterium vincentii ATCC 49256]|uniref:Uncharacterized protein n=1 Tax=Fusobacterium vincentii ATCC 49256 TaxID=209882 RepID=Q7P534_FUSVC|nr:hypothetical protein [Fusobacterium vincentii ATCC 49256]